MENMKKINRNGKEYALVDGKKYNEESGEKTVKAEKSGYIIAHKAEAGEEIDVYTSNGSLEAREKAKAGDIIATRADGNGMPVVDGFNHKNTWIMDEKNTCKKICS